jgi:hypothetical protein
VTRSRWTAGAVALATTLALAATTAFVPSTASAQVTPTDPGSAAWVRVDRTQVAAQCDLDPAILANADRSFPDGYSVVRYGKLCWNGGASPTATFQGYSTTKTFGGIMVGIVASRSSLDDTDLASEWLSYYQRSGLNRDATIAHILAMTATSSNLAVGQKNRFAYDTTGSREINLLVDVIDNVIAREPANFGGARNADEFADQVFRTLGMNDSSWGGSAFGTSLVTSVNDLSRLGLLILRKGRWGGQQLIEEQYVYRQTHPSFPDSNTGLGYLTWMNAQNMQGPSGRSSSCAPYAAWPDDAPYEPAFPIPNDYGGTPYPNPPHDVGVVWAAGLGGQWTQVHRGLDLVLTGHNVSGEWLLWDAVRPALVAEDDTYRGNPTGFCSAYSRSTYAPSLLSPWSGGGTTPTDPEPEPEPGPILEEDFTSGTGRFTASGSTSTGTYGVRMRGGSNPGALRSGLISTVGYTGITLSFARTTDGTLDSGEYGYAEVSSDGGATWTVVERTQTSTGSTVSFQLGAAAADQPDLVVRFRIGANSYYEDFEVDSVRITGTAG